MPSPAAMQTLEAKERLHQELREVQGQLTAEQAAVAQLQANLAQQQDTCERLRQAVAAGSSSAASLEDDLSAQRGISQQQGQVSST